MSEHEQTKILWEQATGYDFIESLVVLHNPAKFGVRGSWTAGVRSRLPQDVRDFLEDITNLLPIPYSWVYNLPEPKDATTILYALKQIPAKDRFAVLIDFPKKDESDLYQRLIDVQKRGEWTLEDRDTILQNTRASSKDKKYGKGYSPKQLEKILGFAADAEAFGEAYLNALKVYYDVFFAEEEKRIAPKLIEAVLEGKEKSKTMPVLDLLEDLSRGLRYEEPPKANTLVMVPSYWSSPLIMDGIWLSEGVQMWMWGARAAGESLVPGEIVPEDLLKILKALADPTRLRILRYLMQEQLTPAEISRRLRLRPPTVTHHLHALRLAGLVRFVMRGKMERLYSARMESINFSYGLLKDFLEDEEFDDDQIDVLDRSRAY